MDWSNLDMSSFTQGAATGGSMAALFAMGAFAVTIAFILMAALYVYTSLAWMVIGKKLKYKYPWLAWIPLANGAMILQMGGFHWAWMFLMLIPIFGWVALGVLATISLWRIFGRLKYPQWFGLIPLGGLIPHLSGFANLAFLIILGVVAWRKK